MECRWSLTWKEGSNGRMPLILNVVRHPCGTYTVRPQGLFVEEQTKFMQTARGVNWQAFFGRANDVVIEMSGSLRVV